MEFLLCFTFRITRRYRHRGYRYSSTIISSNGLDRIPTFFCATTVTSRDIAEELINKNTSVQSHPLEHLCCPLQHWTKMKDQGTICENFISQFEVYVDDFIMMTQVSSSKELLRFPRSLLHEIHVVFHPPIITKHDGKDPISVKIWNRAMNYGSIKKHFSVGYLMDCQGVCLYQRKR